MPASRRPRPAAPATPAAPAAPAAPAPAEAVIDTAEVAEKLAEEALADTPEEV